MVSEPVLVLDVLKMVSARAFSSLSFSECMAERLPCTRHTQVPLFPFIPTYPSYQKKSYYAKGFYCLPKALLRAGAGRAGAQKSRGVCVFLCCCFNMKFKSISNHR